MTRPSASPSCAAPISKPLWWIASNAGHEGSVVVDKVAALPPGQGLDAATGEYTDLIAGGIVDPVKVTKAALRNAASIAAMVLTTEALVVDKPEPTEDAGHGGHGHSH